MKLNIIDKFADWCINQPILEKASERSENIFKIKELSSPLNEHLFKIYSMPDSINKQHWINEVDNFLFKIYSKKWNNKKFETDDYFNWLFIEYFYYDKENYYSKDKSNYNNKVFKILIKLLDKYKSESKINYNIIEFTNKCENFYNIISPKLEKGYPDLDIDDIIIKCFEI